MSDNLVKRLRCYADIDDAVYHPWVYEEAADRIEKLEAQLAQSQLKRWAARWEEQSDRIEKLEAALRHCINAIRQYEMGDDRPRGPAGPVRPWLLGAMDNAIETLEGKDDTQTDL